MTPTVALTGATGFIGGALLRELRLRGVRLRALSRRPQPPVAGVEWVIGTLADAPALARLVAGADRVVHCAGAVRGASATDFDRTNVEGSRQLIAAARRAGCGAALLLSSLAARHPELSWYAASKRAAERAAIAAAADLPLTLFRPTAVYGPGDREMRPLLQWLLRGWLFVPGDPTARISLLHVEDLVAAVAAWLAAPAPAPGVYDLDDGRPGGYDWPAIAAAGAAARGRAVRLLALPQAPITALARANLALARLLGHAPMLTPAKLRELRHPDWTCNNAALRQVLPWTPQLQLEQALRERRF